MLPALLPSYYVVFGLSSVIFFSYYNAFFDHLLINLCR